MRHSPAHGLRGDGHEGGPSGSQRGLPGVGRLPVVAGGGRHARDRPGRRRRRGCLPRRSRGVHRAHDRRPQLLLDRRHRTTATPPSTATTSAGPGRATHVRAVDWSAAVYRGRVPVGGWRSASRPENASVLRIRSGAIVTGMPLSSTRATETSSAPTRLPVISVPAAVTRACHVGIARGPVSTGVRLRHSNHAPAPNSPTAASSPNQTPARTRRRCRRRARPAVAATLPPGSSDGTGRCRSRRGPAADAGRALVDICWGTGRASHHQSSSNATRHCRDHGSPPEPPAGRSRGGPRRDGHTGRFRRRQRRVRWLVGRRHAARKGRASCAGHGRGACRADARIGDRRGATRRSVRRPLAQFHRQQVRGAEQDFGAHAAA